MYLASSFPMEAAWLCIMDGRPLIEPEITSVWVTKGGLMMFKVLKPQLDTGQSSTRGTSEKSVLSYFH